MREIKFRGFLEIQKRWAYGNLILYSTGTKYIVENKLFSEDGHHLMYDPADEPVFINQDTVGQYTGMKDFNGKEIYEGDIIKINEEECYSGEHVGDVCFLDVGGCWYINGVRDGLADINRNYWIDVIGNIYENPEPLERSRIEWLRMLPDNELLKAIVYMTEHNCLHCVDRYNANCCGCAEGLVPWWQEKITLAQFRKDAELR